MFSITEDKKKINNSNIASKLTRYDIFGRCLIDFQNERLTNWMYSYACAVGVQAKCWILFFLEIGFDSSNFVCLSCTPSVYLFVKLMLQWCRNQHAAINQIVKINLNERWNNTHKQQNLTLFKVDFDYCFKSTIWTLKIKMFRIDYFCRFVWVLTCSSFFPSHKQSQ